MLVNVQVANVFEIGTTQRHKSFVLLRIMIHSSAFVRQRTPEVTTNFVAPVLWLRSPAGRAA